MTLPLQHEAARILTRCRELATLTDVPGETTRTFLSPAMRRANTLVAGWMEQAGLAVTQDAAGNLRGVRNPAAPRLILASHLDTVRNAGAFDGPLGVILAIEAAALADVQQGLEVIAFSEEEGVRFSAPFLGSQALVGELNQEKLQLKDQQGISVAQAISAYGLDPAQLLAARLSPLATAYLEIHLEQGPVLEAAGRPLAAVSAISGQTRLRFTFSGQANHAGTTPMALRQDALAAAARFVLYVESHAQHTPHLVATVGEISASPNLINVIPGRVTVSLDVRHTSDTIRHSSLATLLQAAQSSAGPRGVTVSHEVLLEQAAVPLDQRLTQLLVRSAAALGLDATPMPSGAGHDAMILAPHLPSAMLFVRTPGGLSHHPDESVSEPDVAAALAVTLAFIKNLEQAHA